MERTPPIARAGKPAGRHRQVHGQNPAGIPSVGDIALIEPAGASPCVPAADQVGTVWALLDGSGQQANTYEYDAFGVARAASETIPNPYRFGGKPLDPDTAHYHFIARQYMPKLGRFASRDRFAPLAFLISDGLYAAPDWALTVLLLRVAAPRAAPTDAAVFAGPFGVVPEEAYCYPPAPLSRLDPTGLWLSDVHRGRTVQTAGFAQGYDSCRGCYTRLWQADSAAIGAADNAVDFTYGMAPLPDPVGDYSWHFDVRAARGIPDGPVVPGLRADHVKEEFELAVAAAKKGDCDEAMRRLGWSLHPLQDAYAHTGTDPAGHYAETPHKHVSGPRAANADS